MSPRSSLSVVTRALRIRRRFDLVLGILILVLWVLLYLPHLRTNPGWYGDETFSLAAGKNAALGRARLVSTYYTFIPYPAGYLFTAGCFSWATGGDILGARLFNALLALGCAWLLAFHTRRLVGVFGAALAAFAFLGYREAVIHFRMVYPHDLAAFGLLLAIAAISRKNDWIAGGGLLIASQAHPLALNGAMAILPGAFLQKRNILVIIGVPLVAGILYILGLYYFFGNELIEDILWMRHRYSADGAVGSSFVGWNYYLFFSYDLLHVVGILGMIYACCRRKWLLGGSMLLLSFSLLSNRSDLFRFYYQAIVLLPLICLCTAFFWMRVATFARKRSMLLGMFMLILAGGYILYNAPFQEVWIGPLKPRAAVYFTRSTKDVEDAAAFINAHTRKDDFVIANMNIAWLLHCQTADLLEVTAWTGHTTTNFESPRDIRKDRFIYPLDPDRAKYMIIGDFDQAWVLGRPHVREICDPLLDKMQIVWTSKTYTVYGYHPENGAKTSP